MGQFRCSFNLCTKIYTQLFYYIFLAIVLVKGQTQSTELEPEFLGHFENLTVTYGQDVTLTCAINNLGKYRVAWLNPDKQSILSISTHLITRDSRLSVTHDDYNIWKLHIFNVQLTDAGRYMCQINTDPMKFQMNYLDVVEPSDILNQPDVNGDMLEEGIRNEGQTTQMNPSFQRQIPPSIKAVNQLVGAPVESQVTLECIVEVYPKPLNRWYRNEDNLELHDRQKYILSEGMLNLDTWQMNLTIKNLQKSDFGAYTCSSINTLGKNEARIRLYELRLSLNRTTTLTPYVVQEKESAVTSDPEENEFIGSTSEAHTQLPDRNGQRLSSSQMRTSENFIAIYVYLLLLLNLKRVLFETILT